MPDRTGKQKYLYQSKFYQAACVLPEEPLTVAAAKIRQVWDAYPEKLRCTSGGFDVVEGNILKLAFSGEFEEFLNDAIRWKVNLNIVDPSDNHTVLDYVEKWIGINKGNSLEQRYKNYYTKLREAGALHQKEL
jgi:hypothetical protein